MIDKLENIKQGQKIVYYTGMPPRTTLPVFEVAYELFLEGKIILTQKLIARTVALDPRFAISTFEYIAIGK